MLDVSGAQSGAWELISGYVSRKWTRTGFTWEPGGTTGCRRGRPECAACGPTGLRAQACKGSPCLPADPLVPEAARWELILWSVPQAGSGGARGRVTPGRALASWVLRTVGGQERLCPVRGGWGALGAVGNEGPAAARREGTARVGPRLKGLRAGLWV